MDSPRHLACIDAGKTGQFYRIAGQNKFKCASCGLIEDGTSFEPIAFEWKTNQEAWEVWKNKKLDTREKPEKKVKVK